MCNLREDCPFLQTCTPNSPPFRKITSQEALLSPGFELRIQCNLPALNCVCAATVTEILCLLCKHLSTYSYLQGSCAGYLNIHIIPFYLKLPSFYFPLHYNIIIVKICYNYNIGQSVNFYKSSFWLYSIICGFSYQAHNRECWWRCWKPKGSGPHTPPPFPPMGLGSWGSVYTKCNWAQGVMRTKHGWLYTFFLEFGFWFPTLVTIPGWSGLGTMAIQKSGLRTFDSGTPKSEQAGLLGENTMKQARDGENLVTPGRDDKCAGTVPCESQHPAPTPQPAPSFRSWNLWNGPTVLRFH